VHKYLFEYDDEYAAIMEEHFGVKGKPINDKNGVAKISAVKTMDYEGSYIVISKFDIKNKLISEEKIEDSKYNEDIYFRN